MGTRSLTVVQDELGREICVMYRQFDGYPEGHGKELTDFLAPITLVNGIPFRDERRLANGMECLAAQIICYFKLRQAEPNRFAPELPPQLAGGIYLYPTGTRDCGEEYIYTVYPKDGEIYVRCESVYGKEILYDDSVNTFLPPSNTEAPQLQSGG